MSILEWFWLFLILLSAMLCAHAMYKRITVKHNKFYSLIASMSMNMLLWMIVKFIIQISSSESVILFFHEFKYVIILSLPLLFYYHSFAVRFDKRISNRQMLITSAFSVVLMALILTNPLHLFRHALTVTMSPQINTVATDNGILFYIVVGYVYFFISISLSNFVLAFKSRPMLYKHRDLQLIVAMMLPVLTNIVFQLSHLILEMEFDATPIAFFITVVIFYYHFIIKDNQVNNASARKHILDYMDTGVLFLNQYNSIYDANTTFLSIADVSMDMIFNKPLSAFEMDLFRRLSTIKENYDAEQPYDDEYTYLQGSQEVTYHITIKAMHRSNGSYIGTLFSFNDITRLKKSIADYEYLSTHDSITKLYNRHYYEHTLKTMNDYGYFPLGLIVCDIQHLKRVNDTKGYIAGDALLINVSRRLQELSPDKAIICRIGSSEFAIIIPNTTESIIKELTTSMLEMCKNSHIDYAKKSVHIGYALKLEEQSTTTEFLAELSKNTITHTY